jgi:putative transposase
VWEGDHKHVPVEVDVEGDLVTPWVTWFIDCATKAHRGRGHPAHSERGRGAGVFADRDHRPEPFGPVDGLPGQIRVDRGKEFLCRAVTAAMGAFAVPVTDLPAYSPHLKGTVEALNDAVERCSGSRVDWASHRRRHGQRTAVRLRRRWICRPSRGLRRAAPRCAGRAAGSTTVARGRAWYGVLWP